MLVATMLELGPERIFLTNWRKSGDSASLTNTPSARWRLGFLLVTFSDNVSGGRLVECDNVSVLL